MSPQDRERDESVRIELAALKSEVRTGIAGLHRRSGDLLTMVTSINVSAQKAVSQAAIVEARLDARLSVMEQRGENKSANGNGEMKLRESLKFYFWIAAGSIGGTVTFLYFIGKMGKP